ncbi:MAG: hypothetical protein ACREU5_05925 [Burkholderiales bacterium]
MPLGEPFQFSEELGLNLPVAKMKKAGTASAKESSSEFFQRLRPKFLDWRPPTDEEKAQEVKARQEAREAELKRVLEIQKARETNKARIRKP